jgi:Kef-type K+ transport system membrane component KefB
MQDNIIQLLLILFISTLLGWITKTSLYTSFVGYVAGGIVIGTLFTVLGLGAPDTSQQEGFEEYWSDLLPAMNGGGSR